MKTVLLDVRDDIRNGHQPFSRIMAAAAALGADEQLRLIAPFEPVPLFGVLREQGFEHQARALESGDWEVLFARSIAASQCATQPVSREGHGQPASSESGRVEVDARGLEPPQPLVKIIETLAALPANATLRARTDRRPMHLYSQLEQRGFVGETEEQPDGSYLTHIHRA